MPKLPLGSWGEEVIDWLTAHWGGFFDLVTTCLTFLLRIVYDVIAGLKPLPMIIVLVVLAILVMRKIVVPLVLGAGLVLVWSMGLWFEMMQTTATVLVAALVALLIGIPIGIWAAFSPVVRTIVQPVLDFMQTLPVFVYLLPTVLFFGIGPVPGVVATIVFAIPPVVRLTALGIRQVDEETVEAAHAYGAGRMATLREVQFPLAMPSIMAGVNQCIMLALSMVVVAGLVGGGGLGGIVVSAVQSLQIPEAIESGVAVVILAVYLDRLSAAAGGQGRGTLTRRRAAQRAHPAGSAPSAGSTQGDLTADPDAQPATAGAPTA